MSTQEQDGKKPRKRRSTRLKFDTVKVNRPNRKVPTVGELAESLHFSIMYLEIENPHIMPYELLGDAYQMAGMLVEAEGVEPHDALLDNIVFHYLKRRQQHANEMVKEFTPPKTKAGK
jgi:hypothetical protein